MERPFACIEDRFIANDSFASFNDRCRKLKTFEEKMNKRARSVARQIPAQRFERKKDHLPGLPKDHENKPQKFMGFREESRRVTTDCLIAYGGNRCPVPCIYTG